MVEVGSQTRLGRTETTISAIGLGAMPMSLSTRPSEEQSLAVIHRALDLGVRLIDTADSYCRDESDKHHNEKLIARALALYPGDTSDVAVATKGGLMRHGGDWTRNGNPDHLRKTIRESFEALGGERPIDLWQYHAPDPAYSIEVSLQPAIEAQAAGLIRHIGVSNFSVAMIVQARAVAKIVSVQNQYSPWSRGPEEDGVLAYCEREQITFLPWSPLGGSRRVKKLEDFPVLVQLARGKGTSVYSLILAWLRAKSPVVVPIPGASKVGSIEDSVESLKVQLTTTEVAEIDRATR